MRYEINETNETKSLSEILQERNEMLFKELESDYLMLSDESDSRKFSKIGGRMTNYILAELSKLPLMTRYEYCNLDAYDLQEYYINYMQFLKKYNKCEIPSTKPLFCAYMRIPLNKFLSLMTSSNEDLKEVALMIDNDFNCLVFANAESSNNNSQATLVRGKIKDSGQNMVATGNEINFNTLNVISPEENMQRALDIAKSVKQISGKK